MRATRIGWLLSVVLFTFSFNIAFAVSPSDLPIPTQIQDLEEQVDSTITPKYPNPGDTVKIELDAYGVDLNNSTITWTVDGKEVAGGKGQKSVSVVAGKVGVTTTVVATINPANSKTITKTFYINPQSVDIIWEANTYTPPFYKGKAMYTPEQKINIVAIPNLADSDGNLVNPNTVSYKWSQDNTVLGDYSGYGNQSISYMGNILALPVKFDVETSIDNGNTAENYTTISPTAPEVSIYENSPLYGVLWNKALVGSFEFGDATEKSILAIPYSFGITKRNVNPLTYSWTINGSKINVPPSQQTMVFRNSQNLEGVSRVGVTVTDDASIGSSDSAETLINFKKSEQNTSL